MKKILTTTFEIVFKMGLIPLLLFLFFNFLFANSSPLFKFLVFMILLILASLYYTKTTRGNFALGEKMIVAFIPTLLFGFLSYPFMGILLSPYKYTMNEHLPIIFTLIAAIIFYFLTLIPIRKDAEVQENKSVEINTEANKKRKDREFYGLLIFFIIFLMLFVVSMYMAIVIGLVLGGSN